jgi:hypothetical protein
VSTGLEQIDSHIETHYKSPVAYFLPLWIKAFLGVNALEDLLLAVKTMESPNPVSNYSFATQIGDFLKLGYTTTSGIQLIKNALLGSHVPRNDLGGVPRLSIR